MDIVTIDFETYYDREYSLSKMTTEAYVRDPRFEVIGLSIKVNNYPTDWYSGSNPGAFLRQLKYDDRAILSHNSAFDAAILSWHFGIKPKLWLDTLSMARGLGHAATTGLSLKALAAYYHLGQKGDEVHNALGKRRADFTPDEMARYGAYCTQDTDLTYALFRKLAKGFPPSEIQLIDLIIRMYTEPTIELDQGVLREHLTGVVARKEAILAKFDSPDARATLMSNPKFAEYLLSCGIVPPTKISKTTGKATFAFSKTDKEFLDLLEHPDERISAAVAARLGTKSTIEETRTYSLLEVSKRGRLPILLNYYGAHTGRLSGGGGLNLQNLPRGGAIRRALVAPKGKTLVVSDSAQIEARVVAWLAGQHDLVQSFSQKRDVYCEFASEVYGRPITKADKVERFLGKTCLAAGTQVLTRRGWVPIIAVQTSDQLWDGVEWVDHQGVSFMGVKPTISLSGVELTTDHAILTGPMQWESALSVLTNASAFQSALSLATLPSSGMKNVQPRTASCGDGVPYVGAVGADQSSVTTTTTYAPDVLQLATRAQNARHQTSAGGNINLPWQMICTGADYSTACLPQYHAATTQQIECSATMVGAGYLCASSGALTTQPFWSMSSHCQDGTNLRATWTGSTTTRGTSLGIYASQQGQRTRPINDVSMISKPVFDILNSGSRNRFTILTDDGPIIVHNCILGLGYSMGPARFREALALGLGGMKLQITEAEAKRIVDIYRNKNHRITALWNRCSTALSRMLSGMEMDIAPDVLPSLVATRDGIRLPNGMMIRYPALQESGEGVGYMYASAPRAFQEATKAKILGQSPDPAKMTRIYGGKVVENIVQALARIVVTEQMLEIIDRYKIALQVHDEVVVVCDQDEAEECKAYVEEIMSRPPAWAPYLPVACEADYGTSYGEVK
jgi:DNA polymerase I-like protein with 3'-5' exonuclease and polymerase domains